MLSFNYPFFFLLFLAFPIFFFFKSIGVLSFPHLNFNLLNWNGVEPKKNLIVQLLFFVSSFLVYIGIALMIIALTEPVIFKNTRIYTGAGNSIMFLVDISPSMAAKDIDGETRIDSAKKIIQKFVQKYPGDSFGLTALASSVALLVPPTIDHKVFLSRLNSLFIGELGEGTAIGTGLAVCALYASKNIKNSSYIILLSDGENTTGEINPKTAAQALKNKNIGFYVIGIGNTGYTVLEYTDKQTGKTYSGSIYSEFDERELKQIAEDGSGKYTSANSIEMLDEIFTSIAKQVPSTQSDIIQTVEKNLYKYFLMFSILCFSLAWFIRRICLGVSI